MILHSLALLHLVQQVGKLSVLGPAGFGHRVDLSSSATLPFWFDLSRLRLDLRVGLLLQLLLLGLVGFVQLLHHHDSGRESAPGGLLGLPRRRSSGPVMNGPGREGNLL